MTDYKPKRGDRVRVVLEGEVRVDYGNNAFVMGAASTGGSTISGNADHVISIEQVKPALQVGWHRVKRPHYPVVQSMHWSGAGWFYGEDSGEASGYSWESVGYLGTGVKA